MVQGASVIAEAMPGQEAHGKKTTVVIVGAQRAVPLHPVMQQRG